MAAGWIALMSRGESEGHEASRGITETGRAQVEQTTKRLVEVCVDCLGRQPRVEVVHATYQAAQETAHIVERITNGGRIPCGGLMDRARANEIVVARREKSEADLVIFIAPEEVVYSALDQVSPRMTGMHWDPRNRVRFGGAVLIDRPLRTICLFNPE